MPKQRRILLVEDEALVALALQQELRAMGHQVPLAATGDTAIACALKNPPDVLIMDVNLAGPLDGVDTTLRIQERLDVDVLFITGYDESALRARANGCRPLAYLVKPVEAHEIAALLHHSSLPSPGS